MVPSRRRILPAPALAALVLLALAGCGGGDEPASAVTSTVTVARTVTVPARTSTGAGASAPAPAPLTLHAAEDVLASRGYAALGERDWRPHQTLKLLLGISRDDGPRKEQAFFFAGERYIGTDTKDPSGSIEVLAQSDDAITLAYGLYRPSDPIDAPSGGSAEVTYRWDGSKLTPQDPIPTASPDAPLSRR